MAYVITGATGHIGNNLIRKLSELGEDVKIVVRKKTDYIKDLNIEIIEGSFLDEVLMNDIIAPGDYVIHLAAYINLVNKDWNTFYDVNIKGTVSLAEISYKKHVKKFLYASSTEALSKPNRGAILEPAHTIDTSKFKSYYSISKAEATNYLLNFKEKHPDFNLAIVYPGCVVGINDYKPSEIGKVFIDCLKGKMEFTIRGHYSFVNVKDIVSAIINICKFDKQGSFLLTGTNKSVMELYESINRILENNKKPHRIPRFLAYMAIPFVKYLSKTALDILMENDDYRIDKAKSELNYNLTDFDLTIKETLEWFRDYYL
ncbi:NAD-dependent epimerase/dehydratase family protein [bacterium]|nr:NAD-dependent epimerase/dehydratase family protein [bacterium]